jgi:hypothetical protein
MPRADDQFKVLEKINENAYKLDLAVDFGVSLIFNIADLKSYLREEDEFESRMTQMQEGDDDVDITSRDEIKALNPHNRCWPPSPDRPTRILN